MVLGQRLCMLLTPTPSSASSSAPEEHNEDGSESWRTMVVRMLDALSSLTLPTLLSRRTADAGSAVTPAHGVVGRHVILHFLGHTLNARSALPTLLSWRTVLQAQQSSPWPTP
eukprot:1149295-Pelagomonas_calceolata.AAC.2